MYKKEKLSLTEQLMTFRNFFEEYKKLIFLAFYVPFLLTFTYTSVFFNVGYLAFLQASVRV